jgi:hypothetical protein
LGRRKGPRKKRRDLALFGVGLVVVFDMVGVVGETYVSQEIIFVDGGVS